MPITTPGRERGTPATITIFKPLKKSQGIRQCASKLTKRALLPDGLLVSRSLFSKGYHCQKPIEGLRTGLYFRDQLLEKFTGEGKLLNSEHIDFAFSHLVNTEKLPTLKGGKAAQIVQCIRTMEYLQGLKTNDNTGTDKRAHSG